MMKWFGILLSTTAIGFAGAAATPAKADPAVVVPLAAAAAGGVLLGTAATAYPYGYEPQGSERWEGQTQLAPPADYPDFYPSMAYAYPHGGYAPAPYAYPPSVYAPAYGGACHEQSERVPSGGGGTEWRNYTICD